MRALAGNLPQHTYTIPYSFTQAEIQDWLSSQWDNVPLQGYLSNPELTPAGQVVQDGYAQVLVWLDASNVLHVIDVTNMNIAKHVNDASFESPDSSAVVNAVKEVMDILGSAAAGVKSIFQWLPVIAAGAALLYVWPRR